MTWCRGDLVTRIYQLQKKLLAIYDRLLDAFGPRRWWPAETPFEVIVGAILTQNTAWKNVEKAISSLKKEKLLSPSSLASKKEKELALLIRPAGYYNIKAKRLKNFVNFLTEEFGGSLDRMFKMPLGALRKRLLEVNGIGPETADSILLYAGNKPVFVVDAYTKRVFSRHKLIKKDALYREIQSAFTENLPRSRKLFSEYHALIVELAKTYCRKKPRCGACPLKKL